jgi:hypothetical protein
MILSFELLAWHGMVFDGFAWGFLEGTIRHPLSLRLKSLAL